MQRKFKTAPSLRLLYSFRFKPYLSLRTFASYKGVEYTPILMPKLSPTATESKVEEWLVKEGDFIEPGDSYCTVETDKASMSHDALEEGYIARLFKSGGMIPINKMIGIQISDKKDIPAFKDFDPSKNAENSEEISQTQEKKDVLDVKTTEKDENTPKTETNEADNLRKSTDTHSPDNTQNAEEEIMDSKADEKRVFATPRAKALAEEHEIDLKAPNLTATGLHGALTEADVLKITTKPLKPLNKDALPKPEKEISAEFTDIPLTAMRKTIAKRLSESKSSIPHFNVSMECKIDRMMSFRKRLNKIVEADGVKISVNDIIIKAAALALKKVPEVNSSWQTSFIRQFKAADISVAVSTPKGLLTPIVKSAENKGLSQISQEMKKLASKARQGTLSPFEFIGGSFSISNLGMMGVSDFSAIINPPQSAILAVGGVKKELYVDSEGDVKEKKVMKVNLSCDHRTVDGAKAAEWLVAFRKYLENPETMLL